jgi:hypothetical protein
MVRVVMAIEIGLGSSAATTSARARAHLGNASLHLPSRQMTTIVHHAGVGVVKMR